VFYSLSSDLNAGDAAPRLSTLGVTASLLSAPSLFVVSLGSLSVVNGVCRLRFVFRLTLSGQQQLPPTLAATSLVNGYSYTPLQRECHPCDWLGSEAAYVLHGVTWGASARIVCSCGDGRVY
jgi:hypothetical protein